MDMNLGGGSVPLKRTPTLLRSAPRDAVKNLSGASCPALVHVIAVLHWAASLANRARCDAIMPAPQSLECAA